MIYEASVHVGERGDSPPMKYVGLCKTTFKERYRTHVSSFNNFRLRKQSELAEFIWDLKQKNKSWNIKWRKICHEQAYNTSTGRCNLCLREKLEISKLDPKFSINKKSELFKNCLHKWRFKLASFDYDREETKLRKGLSQADNLTLLSDENDEVTVQMEEQSMNSLVDSQQVNLSSNSSKQYSIRNQSTEGYMTRRKAKELNILLEET